MFNPFRESRREREEIIASEALRSLFRRDPAGARELVRWILERTGTGRRAVAGESAELYNFGRGILEEVCEAAPMEARALIGELYFGEGKARELKLTLKVLFALAANETAVYLGSVLREAGAGDYRSDGEPVEVYNFAMDLLEQVRQAEPGAALDLAAGLYIRGRR